MESQLGSDVVYDQQVETAPWERVRSDAFARLQRQVEKVSSSPYYRERFDEAGFDARDLRSESDLAGMPFFTKDDERTSQERWPPLGGHLCVHPDEVVRVQSSSGTTGSPTLFALTRRDLATWDHMMARTYFCMGLRETDTYAALSNLSMFVGGIPSVTAAGQLGATVVPIGTNAGTEAALRLAHNLNATVLGLTPSYALYLGERLESLLGIPASEFGLRRLLIGGEPGAQMPALRKAIEGYWGCPVRDVMGIGELGGAFWAESDDESGMHFCGQGEVFLELIDPETGLPRELADGETGELVYSAIEREATPVLRYRSGDIVEVSMGDVPSGRTSPRVRVIGRSDDMLHSKGVNLFPSAVADVVARFRPAVSGHIRVVGPPNGTLAPSPLPVVVELGEQRSAGERSSLSEAVASELRAELKVKCSVHVVEPGTLPRSSTKTSLLVREPLEAFLEEIEQGAST